MTAPHDGAARVHVTEGAQVARDDVIAEVVAAPAPVPPAAPTADTADAEPGGSR